MLSVQHQELDLRQSEKHTSRILLLCLQIDTVKYERLVENTSLDAASWWYKVEITTTCDNRKELKALKSPVLNLTF